MKHDEYSTARPTLKRWSSRRQTVEEPISTSVRFTANITWKDFAPTPPQEASTNLKFK